MQEFYSSSDCTQTVEIQRRVRAEISFLRRHGRSLTGEQHLADLSVVQLMEDLLIEPGLMAASVNPRIALHRRLLHILDNLSQICDDPLIAGLPTPRSRQAHLLTTVEGFSRGQAAEILSITVTEVDALLEDARRAVALQAGARILIIEDEQFIAIHLESLVQQLGHEAVGVAPTMSSAIAQAQKTKPELILSDVNLADGSSGHDAVQEILKEQNIPVIFITAYAERLLTGTCPEPAFLITKPFNDEAVKATISQAHFLNQQKR